MAPIDSNLPRPSGDGDGESPFDRIRREDENGEWWSARDLQPVMGYDKWENFLNVIERAIRSVKTPEPTLTSNFPGSRKVQQAMALDASTSG